MITTVHVTANDIYSSRPDSHHSCPIARALKRIVKDGVDVSVWGNQLIINDFAWDFDEQIPHQLNSDHEDHKDFTIEDLEPFAFRINIPSQYLSDWDEKDDNSSRSSYTIQFQKGNTTGEYILRDNQGDTVILTTEQIEKLYNVTRNTTKVWTSL